MTGEPINLLGVIRACDVFIDEERRSDEYYTDIRTTVRLALEDESGNIAFVLYPKRLGFPEDYYGIIGGGVHEGESLEIALRREAREETG